MRFPIALFLPLLLAACNSGQVRDTLGLNRSAPDEFTVISRPPLALPPDFDLRPPKPGEAPRGISTEDEARSVLTGKPVPLRADTIEMPRTETAVVPVVSSDAPSGAEANFLKKTGATGDNSDIRTQLGAEDNKPVDTKNAKSLYEKLVGPDSAEPVVDPKKEAARLRNNKEAGKPLNEGEVPVAPTKPPSVIDRIF
jgi:hypothetical protein